MGHWGDNKQQLDKQINDKSKQIKKEQIIKKSKNEKIIKN